eukprot:scaffold58743_cov30-Prasinocladus_malaysianus.AAC.1
MCMYAHAWGQEYELIEPYHCPGCGAQITEAERHLPNSSAKHTEFLRLHYGQRPGCPPILPIEPWDAVCDTLHGFIRSLAHIMLNMSVTRALKTEADAKLWVEHMQERLGVTCKPYYAKTNMHGELCKAVQKLNGEECWTVLANIGAVLSWTHGIMSRPYSRHLDMYDKFITLLSLIMIEDVATELWPAFAHAIEVAADLWHAAFLLAGGVVGVFPTMHTMVAHYGDL